ncbi:MAG: hypothetical protein Q8M16_14410 [Pirellulaceae bacterium]|nr:hypothetical protein [Pirellulaceae bacterium]
MSPAPVRELHGHQPVPMEQIFRVANRVNIETMLIVIAYAAVFLRLVTIIDWQMNEWATLIGGLIVLSIVWAVGMYHARLKWCVADYYGRRPSFPLYCLWPLQSMLLIGGLLLIGGCCAALGFSATLACVTFLTLCIVQSEAGFVVGALIGTLPGCIAGFLLATSVISKLGYCWLRLT